MRMIHGCDPCPINAEGDTTLDELLGAAPDQLDAAPSKLDLSGLVLRIRDQGKAGTCVGFGVTQAAANAARQSGFTYFQDMSALATYIQARALERALKSPGDGTTIDAALRAVAAGGYLFEDQMPYKPELRHQGFKLGQGQAALRRCGLRSHRITGSAQSIKDQVKVLLANGRGVVGGWQLRTDFELWTPDQGPFDGGQGAIEGGHCMCVQDYPDGNPRLCNSWGPDVGDEGFWTVTWDVIGKATSLWAIDFVP